MNDELEDLENLTKHPGWHRFVEHGKQEVEARLNTALTNAANNTDDTVAINQVRQCVAVRQAIETLLQWPGSRLSTLAQAKASRTLGPSFSRRGGL